MVSAPGPTERVLALQRQAPFCDVHAHPSLARFLFGHDLWHRPTVGPGFAPFQLRSGFPQLEAGGVGVVWASHYVPESEIFDDCSLLKWAGYLVAELERLRAEDRCTLLGEMLEGFEAEVAREPARVEVARSAPDLARIAAEGRLAVVHCVEGAHVLGGDPDRVDELARRGVASLTLAHFFPNDLFAQTVGIPPELLRLIPCRFRFHADEDPPVAPAGYAVLERMVAGGVLPDVCHLTPRARRAVYEAVRGRIPVIASHVGLHRFCAHPYNLDEGDLVAIAASGGAVGLILMPQWLRCDGEKSVLDVLHQRLAYVAEVTGSWDHVMLGSDFDGFTDAPEDCCEAAQLWKITAGLLERGVCEEKVRKVIGGNAMRVLREGWGATG